MSVNIIVAVGNYMPDKGFPIGKNGKVPWHNSADLKWFKETTMGHPIIMGKRTWESLGEKPLAGRTNIVISSKHTEISGYDNVINACSVENAIALAKAVSNEDVFIIGGASVYKYALENDLVDKVYMDMLAEYIQDADTFFPNLIPNTLWEETGTMQEIEKHKAYATTFVRIRGVDNHVDEQYLKLVNEIIKNGEEKDTRAGKTRSLFGRQLRFNLKEGLPILTTKKVFTKGVIHELLWFLKGDTNIKYLVDNNVHIWDDDAYRYYLELVKKENEWNTGCFIEYPDGRIEEIEKITPYDKETFLKYVKLNAIHEFRHLSDKYVYGDLNHVYGYQWTKWGGHNQIQEVIDTLKKNPDDRRMIISAWNVEDIPDMALPPCHFCCQFYTKRMASYERVKWACEHLNETAESIGENMELLNEWNVPTRKLSCCFHMRGTDCISGLPFNITSYSLLTHMIAQCVNMDVDELIYEVGDCHVYENHIAIYEEEQKNNNPHMYALPKLQLNPNITNIFNFNYADIKILKYQSYPSIKYPLNTGLDKIT